MARSARRPPLDGRCAKPFILAGIVLALALSESPGGEDKPTPSWGTNVPTFTQLKPDITTAKLLADYDRRIYDLEPGPGKPVLYKKAPDLFAYGAEKAAATALDGTQVTLTCFICGIYTVAQPPGTFTLGITKPVEVPPDWVAGDGHVRIPGTKEQAAKISPGDVLTMRGPLVVRPGPLEDGLKCYEMSPAFTGPGIPLRLRGFDYTITPESQVTQIKPHAETAKFIADYYEWAGKDSKATPQTPEAYVAAQNATLAKVPLTLTCFITSVYAVAPTKDQPASIGLSLALPAEVPIGWYGDPTVRIPGGPMEMAKIHLGDTLVIRGKGKGLVDFHDHNRDRLKCYGLRQSAWVLEIADFDYTIVPAAPAAKVPPTSAVPKATPTAAPPAKQP